MNPARYAAALERVTRVPHVRGAMFVAIEDGLSVAESLMDGVRGDAAAALASSLAGRFEQVTEAAQLGQPKFLHLVAERGSLITVPAGPGLVVVVVTDPEINIGLARLEMLRAAEAVGDDSGR